MTSAIIPVASNVSRASKRPREDDDQEAAAPAPRRPRLDSATPFLQDDVDMGGKTVPISRPLRQSTPFPTPPPPSNLTPIPTNSATSSETPLPKPSNSSRHSDDPEHKCLHDPSRITSRPRRPSSSDSSVRFSPSRPGGLLRRTLLNELIRSMYQRLETGVMTEPDCPLHGSLKTAWDHLKRSVERDLEEADDDFEDEDMDDDEWDGGDGFIDGESA